MKLEMFFSSVTGITFLVLDSYPWPVAPVLDSTAVRCIYLPVPFVDPVPGPGVRGGLLVLVRGRDGWMFGGWIEKWMLTGDRDGWKLDE